LRDNLAAAGDDDALAPAAALLCCTLVPLQAPPALAWRGVGHRIICVIMFREMDG
jgi:hypothetical protein